MEFVFDWDRLSDSLREPCIGVVVHVQWNCDCAICRKSPVQVQNRLHIAFVPLDKQLDVQSAWYNYSTKKWSSWGAFCLSMKRLGLTAGVSSLQELLEKLKGRVFEWHSVTVVKYIEQQTGLKAPSRLPETLAKKETWIPVRTVKETEIEFILRQDFRGKDWKQEAQRLWQEHLKEHEESAQFEEAVTNEFDLSP